MTRENIRVSDPNFTYDGEYFYCLLKTAQTLQVKTDDGNIAFSYPVDTTIGNTIETLEWDGVYFWSIEDSTGGFKIRKWALDDYILKQISVYTFTSGGIHTYSADDMAVEHYRLTLGNNDNGSGGYTVGIRDINVSDTTKISIGDRLTFVRARTPAHLRYATSYVETGTVQEILSATSVRLTSVMSSDPYGDGKGFRGPSASYVAATEPVPPDYVYVHKYLWVLNAYAPSDLTTAALYKINAYNGSNVVQYTGTQYSGINAATFYTKYNTSGVAPNVYNTTVVNDATMGGLQTYLLFAKGSTLLFFNTSTLTIDRSMAIDNVKADNINLWTVYDLATGGNEPNITLYRLQRGTTYGDPASDESWSSAYSYERTILRRYVKSISVSGEPTVVPADGASTSRITAVVKDQYNTAVNAKTVAWTDDAGGRLSPTSSTTDIFGRAFTTYTAGTTEADVKITATVPSGLV